MNEPVEWWEQPAEPRPASTYTPEKGREDWQQAVAALGDLNEAARLLDRAVMHGAQFQMEALHPEHVVALVAGVQDVRRLLAETEAALARTVGRDEMAPREGVLPDGRRYEVRKGANRKAWDHDRWREDVRAQVLSGVGPLVDTDTGEAVDPWALLQAVQEAHGAGAPRVGALKALGLDVGDYCETVPGPWGLQVTGSPGVAP